MEKNANNKVNRWSLELATYNITFEWISGAKNKAADCLSRLIPTTGTSINMLTASTPDGPAFHTRSHTQSVSDSTPTPQLMSQPHIPQDNDPTPKSITEDCREALLQMQCTDPFCKCISKRLLNGRAPHHESDTFTHIKGLLYKHVSDAGKQFLALVIPKSWKFTVLVEAHDKLGHQGNNRMYCIIKRQYYWKGMNKDIRKYIANCVLCRHDKAKVHYPLQMTEIPDRPFDKIAIDLVTDCETSASGNKHILTIIDHLTGWPEAFPIPNKSADTIVATLINNYLPVHMCPRYILSDNGTEFKNNLMDQVLQQLGIDRIFSDPYHPQSNGKLEVFHKYLKPTLKKLCENDPMNWDKYINQVLASYRITPNLATTESPFFLVYGRNPNLPLHQLLEMACYCPQIHCYDCHNYGHVAMDCPDKILPSGTPSHHKTNNRDRNRRSSSRQPSHTRRSCHNHRDRSRFSHSHSHPHNHSYRSSSRHEHHRNHSRSSHRCSCCSSLCNRSSSSHCYCRDTPHTRPSCHNSSRDDSRSRHNTKHCHYKPAQG